MDFDIVLEIGDQVMYKNRIYSIVAIKPIGSSLDGTLHIDNELTLMKDKGTITVFQSEISGYQTKFM